ncbi:MAG: RluA family pseudouridine synthase [Bacilli bacterium]|nr:RluA family pseudouridine synthase [Bacilli bacterium]
MIVEEENIRIDTYLSNKLDISRSKIQKLIDEEKVTVNGKVIKSNYKTKLNDEIEIDDELDFDISVEPVEIPLDIVYEDEYLMIINKPSGLVVHPAPGHYDDTLVNGLLFYLNKDKTKNIRPGIVHRLDKDTSGLMVVAKDEKTMELLSEMISKKEVERKYLAIVDGVIKENTATINAPIGRDPSNRQKMAINPTGKNAITHIKVIERFKNNTFIECLLDTGRTHQIRVHLSYINHRVTNDPVYGEGDEFGQMLHSYSIKFIHPITKKELYFEQDPPKEFIEELNKLRESNE